MESFGIALLLVGLFFGGMYLGYRMGDFQSRMEALIMSSLSRPGDDLDEDEWWQEGPYPGTETEDLRRGL